MKGAIAEVVSDLTSVYCWADGKYLSDCHRNVERYHRQAEIRFCFAMNVSYVHGFFILIRTPTKMQIARFVFFTDV